jgi:SpoVK/Ycf46/Vps4 family AAA+-type ATPase
MVFMGSPGTGKSTVAERVAVMLKEYGLVVTNDVPLILVKSDLVGQHIGETEAIVKQKLDEAAGRVLFIDEAYTLFETESDNDFGKIALNEIMYAMEKRRDRLVVILAGYTDEMLYMLKNANPGLTSRIPWYFCFDDFSSGEMWEILDRKVRKNGYRFNESDAEAIKSKALDCFTVLKKEMDGVKGADGKTKHYFGNGRGVRKFFQYMQIGLAVRLNGNYAGGDLRTFNKEEIDYAYNTFKKGKLAEDDVKRIGFSRCD